MKFRIGDRVKFKDEPDQGVITRIDGEGMIYVKTGDDFERPAFPEDIMLTGMTETVIEQKPVNNRVESVIEAPEEKVNEDTKAEDILMEPEGQDYPLVYLGILQKEENFAFYLVNDSGYQLFFNFGRMKEINHALTLEKGVLEADTKYLLAELSPGPQETLFIQCLFFGDRIFIPRPPCDKQVPFGAASLPRAREFKNNPYFDEKAWLIPLVPQSAEEITIDEKKKSKLLKEKGDLPERKLMMRPNISGNELVEEVDLHIESIVENSAALSKGEILEAQLARFETALEGAIRNRQKKIVFIHGLGNGRLKYEVRKHLDLKKIRYQDASFKEYGYGATLVILK